jgi:hypothetical protein
LLAEEGKGEDVAVLEPCEQHCSCASYIGAEGVYLGATFDKEPVGVKTVLNRVPNNEKPMKYSLRLSFASWKKLSEDVANGK